MLRFPRRLARTSGFTLARRTSFSLERWVTVSWENKKVLNKLLLWLQILPLTLLIQGLHWILELHFLVRDGWQCPRQQNFTKKFTKIKYLPPVLWFCLSALQPLIWLRSLGETWPDPKIWKNIKKLKLWNKLDIFLQSKSYNTLVPLHQQVSQGPNFKYSSISVGKIVKRNKFLA